MVMWLMSDRAIPRSFRMMEGFGVHTFRFVNDRNKSRFVKFHWKPLLGLHSVVWDEAQKISGMDPDFHRRDLWEAIETGRFPQWELGVQVVEEKDEHRFDFDLLDPTKIIPEEMVPVRRIGRLTLNRNPDNFFAETEQVAFHPGHLVPGIDFSDDPLLQGRLFSYLDTQLIRHQRNEIPEGVVRRRGLRYLMMGFRLDGVHQIGKLDGILNEKYGNIITHQIEVPFLGIELHGEAAHVPRQIRRPSGTDDRGEPYEDGRLSCGILEKFGFRQGSHRLVHLKDAMGGRAAGMHHTFWDSFMVEMRDLLAEMKILKEGRPALSSFQLILIIIEQQALIRRQELVVAVLSMIG